MEATTSTVKPKGYINKPIKLTYQSSVNQVNIIHGVINAVTKDYISFIDFNKREHIIKKTNLKEIIEVKRINKPLTNKPMTK